MGGNKEDIGSSAKIKLIDSLTGSLADSRKTCWRINCLIHIFQSSAPSAWESVDGCATLASDDWLTDDCKFRPVAKTVTCAEL